MRCIIIQKITIYLDFDGVFNINPYYADKIIKKPYTKSVFLKNKKNVAVNTEVLSYFKELLDSNIYEVKWLTTWNHNSGIKAILPMIELDNHITFIYPNINRHSKNKKEWTEWKAKAIIQDQEQVSSPFIWIDDTAPRYWDTIVKNSTKKDKLIISPSRSIGLTKKDIVNIIDWSKSIMLDSSNAGVNNG